MEAFPREFADDVDFLLASSSRKAAISRECDAQRVVPEMRLRRRSRQAAGRYTVRQCVWHESDSSLNVLLQKSKSEATGDRPVHSRCVEIDVLVPVSVSEPFFCLSADHMASRPDPALSVAVAQRCNERAAKRLQQNQHCMTLLEFVAEMEMAATELAAVATATSSSSASASSAPTAPSEDERSSLLESRLWDELSSHNVSCRLLLGLLDTACQSLRRATLAEPNPFSDDIIPVSAVKSLQSRSLTFGLSASTPTNSSPSRCAAPMWTS